MQPLKLVALDEEDLAIISAHVQDAVMKVGDISFLPARKRLVLVLNRFVWEKKHRWFSRDEERRRSVLHFERVLSLASAGIDRTAKEQVLSLLALRFTPSDAPAGVLELLFSGGATLRLQVECVEAGLADTGGAWQARGRPRHAV